MAMISQRKMCSRSVALLLAAATSLAAGSADAHSQSAATLYKQAVVEKCLTAEKVVFLHVTRAQLNPLVLSKFPGVTGTVGIARGGGNTTTDHRFGPAIDSGTLIFEKTAAMARRDRAGLYAILHDSRVSPLNPPAPAPFIGSLQSVRRNVVILWDYPNKHAALSTKLVDACLPSHT